jgi:NAD(P)-dependent dehydrogenase (short-subunit alcohol dehydrogenase family)
MTSGLLDAGYCVSTFSRRATKFTDSLSGCERYWFATADVGDSTSLAGFVSAAEERFGVPYGLVNCAGIAFDGMLATMPEDKIDDLLMVNLGGTLKLTRLIIRACSSAAARCHRQHHVVIGQRGQRAAACAAEKSRTRDQALARS